MGEPMALLWQSIIGAVLLIVVAGAVVWIWYILIWEKNQKWEEARRHHWRLRMKIERWIRFRWIHYDSLYWIIHVRFDRGPIILSGFPTDAVYWSVTYYAGTEVNASISSSSVVLEDDGSYNIEFSETPGTSKNHIPVRASDRRGVIYLRIYEPAALFPSQLPTVTQNGTTLTEGGIM